MLIPLLNDNTFQIGNYMRIALVYVLKLD